MIYFEKIFKALAFAIYGANNLGIKFLSTCYSNFWWIPS